MAITWDVQISNVDVSQKRADVTAVRTDDVSGDVETYSYTKAIIGTTQERQGILQSIWDNHLAAANNQTAIDAFVDNLETAAKANLEARE